MRRRNAVVLCAVLVGGGLVALGPAPIASAQEVCVGTGTTTVGDPGLYYPLVGMNTSTWGLNEINVILRPLPNLLPFAFGLGALGVCVAGQFPLTTSGMLSGWCGHGWGVGVTSDGHRLTWVDAGGRLIVTGGLVGTGSLIHNIFSGQSCYTGSLGFLITGEFVKIHCNVLKQNNESLPFVFPDPMFHTLTTVFSTTLHLTIAGGNYHYWTKLCVGVL